MIADHIGQVKYVHIKKTQRNWICECGLLFFSHGCMCNQLFFSLSLSLSTENHFPPRADSSDDGRRVVSRGGLKGSQEFLKRPRKLSL